MLTYCTSGVLLRMLTVDELVNDMTHIILDEIHEREQNTDYLLIALKQALRTRKDLKVFRKSKLVILIIFLILGHSNVGHDGRKLEHFYELF